MGLIGIAALILTVSGWHREDIRDLGAEIEQRDAKVDQIDTRLAVVEVRISAAVHRAGADRRSGRRRRVRRRHPLICPGRHEG